MKNSQFDLPEHLQQFWIFVDKFSVEMMKSKIFDLILRWGPHLGPPSWGRTEWTATQFDTHDLNERPVVFLWRTATDFGGERPRTLEANGNPYKINCFIIW